MGNSVLIEKIMGAIDESLSDDGISLRKAAKILKLSHTTLWKRIKEAEANPEKSAIKNGVHFKREGRQDEIKIFKIAELKKAIAKNDQIFKRK